MKKKIKAKELIQNFNDSKNFFKFRPQQEAQQQRQQQWHKQNKHELQRK